MRVLGCYVSSLKQFPKFIWRETGLPKNTPQRLWQDIPAAMHWHDYYSSVFPSDHYHVAAPLS